MSVSQPPIASPIRYYGGKQRHAAEIAALIPDAPVYVEVFGGGGSVLLARPRRTGTLEVYNDGDGEVVNFFRALREEPDELIRLLALTPYSRGEYELARDTYDDASLPDVERARRYFVAVEQAFGSSLRRSQGWGGQRLGNSWRSAPETMKARIDRLGAVADRLRDVQIECLDWRDCLNRYDHADAVFYLDPPYLPEARTVVDGYRAEMTAADHAELVDRLLSSVGSWVLSGYATDVYAPLDAFERYEIRTRASASPGNVAPRTEVLWRRSAATARVQERLAL